MTPRFALLAPAVLLAAALIPPAPSRAEDDRLSGVKKAFDAALEDPKKELLKAVAAATNANEAALVKKQIKFDAYETRQQMLSNDRYRLGKNLGLPKSPQAQTAVGAYRAALKKATDTCKEEFEAAAKEYRAKGEGPKAAAALEELEEYLTKGAFANDGMAYDIGRTFRLSSARGVLVPERRETDAGTKVVTAAAWVAGDDVYMWKMTAAGGGWVYFENVKAGLVLTKTGQGDKTEIVIAKKEAKNEAQHWKPVPTQVGYRLRHRGTTKGLIASDPRVGDGLGLVKWETEGAPFEVFQTGAPAAGPGGKK